MYHFVDLAKLRAPLQQSKAPKSYIIFKYFSNFECVYRMLPLLDG